MPVAQRIESDAYIEKILADSDSYRRDNNIGKFVLVYNLILMNNILLNCN